MIKKSFYLFIGALAVLSVQLVSCSKDTETIIIDAPNLTVSVATVTASYEGGSYGFTYTISNPVKDGIISCSTTSSWISNISDSGLGINFIVSENNTEDIRTGQIELSYESSIGIVKKTITVTQNTCTTPQIVIQSASVIADVKGGSYAFTYTINNPADDGEVSCVADVDWISDFYCTTGRVSFEIDENSGASSFRQGTITLIYTYGNKSAEGAVTVIQDHENGGLPSIVDDLVGTYRADGDVFFSSGTAGTYAWTLKIFRASSNEVIIDGLVPMASGTYPGSEAYIARASLNSESQIVIPAQFTGYYNSSLGVYVGWTPCVEYTGSAWTWNGNITDCTLTYDVKTGVWTSDYGEFLAGFTTNGDLTTYSGFFDVSNPGFTITKRSNSTETQSMENTLSYPLGENLTLHADFIRK